MGCGFYINKKKNHTKSKSLKVQHLFKGKEKKRTAQKERKVQACVPSRGSNAINTDNYDNTQQNIPTTNNKKYPQKRNTPNNALQGVISPLPL
ncbi:hypothetical protein [Prevotella veroralis]|uniref:Uncharacterized protein n=1 Tax=Prevotella veroralis F0319 TaxID=649761 RepID=C9MPR1_9BACT|nr:hypothetical protein [Prevotella veroralis]EEX18414.1 hypothetical protein HMPREF0973_01602 [Prevotella veroralis F0319]